MIDLIATAAFALPVSQQSDVKGFVVEAYYNLDYAQQKAVCQVWRAKPVKVTKRFTAIAVENGYAFRPAAKGVIKGFMSVCGRPYGY